MTSQFQKEVYMLAREILRNMRKYDSSNQNLTAIDVGCGSGWKLVNYLSKEFRTVGIETEPALSFLQKTYPNQVSERFSLSIELFVVNTNAFVNTLLLCVLALFNFY